VENGVAEWQPLPVVRFLLPILLAVTFSTGCSPLSLDQGDGSGGSGGHGGAGGHGAGSGDFDPGLGDHDPAGGDTAVGGDPGAAGDDLPAGDGATPGDDATASPGDDAPPGDTDLLDDYATLTGCGETSSCPSSLAQLVVDETHGFSVESTCLLRALRDRTVGLYLHRAEVAHSDGYDGADHAVWVDPDGTARYVRRGYVGGATPDDGQFFYEVPHPAERCTLKPASYFDDCANAFDGPVPDDDLAWSCVYGPLEGGVLMDWFETCIVESPLACP
jgi:hypothetical protein